MTDFKAGDQVRIDDDATVWTIMEPTWGSVYWLGRIAEDGRTNIMHMVPKPQASAPSARDDWRAHAEMVAGAG